MSFDSGAALKYVPLFQQGDERAFNYFFKELYPALTYYAFNILKDKPVAEEIVGDSFIKIWERREHFNHAKAIKSWLYIAVRNASLLWLRAQKRTKEQEQQLAALMKDDFESPAYVEMIGAEVMRELYAALSTLPPNCREVFKLHFFMGKSVQDIADEMKVSFFTIKNQRARGLQLLRKRLPELYWTTWIVLMIGW